MATAASPEAEPAAAAGSGDAQKAADGVSVPVPEDLTKATLPLDIATASFYELADWAASLGLSTEGSAGELRTRLYEHYGVKPPAEAALAKRTVTIEKAAQAEYFKVESGEGSVIRISGGVILTLRDEEKGEKHRLEADEILYDKDNSAVTARGRVHYRREKGSTVEEFTGETLSVDLDNWSGVFLDGKLRMGTSSASAGTAASTSSAPTAGTSTPAERKFSFQAATIERRTGDVIVMDDGVISACDADHPHYSIRAKRLWLLGEGDWALASGVLSIGEVPLLWLPFLYYPSEEIVFHPVLGYRSRAGRFVQTTTYLIGRKAAKKGTGFLSMVTEDSNAEKEVHGFFLKPIAGTTAKAENGSSLKLLADAYSSLGAMVGINGSFPKAGPFSSLAFTADVGVSRSLFSANSGYSPFVYEGDYTSQWNTTSFGTMTFPFRYALSFSSGFKAGPLSATIALPFYSDPYFEEDFLDRSEDMDWLGLSSATTSKTTTISDRTSFDQKINFTLSQATGPLSPWLSSIDLSYLSASLSWLSKTNTTLSSTETSSTLFYADPSRYFFYPNIMKPLDASATFRGSLVPKAAAVATAAATSATGGLNILPPWGDASGDQAKADKADPSVADPFRLPARLPDFPTATKATQAAGLTADWTFTPAATLESRFLSDSWLGPASIDFSDNLYSLTSYKLSGSLTTGYALPSNLASASLAFAWNTQDGSREVPAALEGNSTYTSLLSSYALADAQYKQTKLTSSFKLQAKPFVGYWLLSPSSLSYSLDSILYNYAYKSMGADSTPVYAESLPAWNSDMVTAHSATATLGLLLGGKTESLGLTVSIPPLSEAYTPSLALSFGAGDFSLDFSARTRAYRASAATVFSYDPMSLSLSLGAPLGFKLTDSYTYDFQTGAPKTNAASLSWGPLTATLQAKQSQLYEPVAGAGWEAIDGDAKFRISNFQAAFKQSLSTDASSPYTASFAIDSSYSQNLLMFSESTLSFGLSLTLKISDFIDLSFTSLSQNSAAWRYCPWLFSAVDDVGGADEYFVNPLKDIANSFAFWDDDKRTASLFKLKNISVKLVHYLHDWDMSFTLSAAPELITTKTPYYYVLNPTFEFLVTWKDFSEIKASLTKTSSGYGS